MATERRVAGIAVFTLALACALMAVIWPQWRSELQGYNYNTPGISIGAPNAATTSAGPVTYPITYTHATTVTLAVKNVTLNKTGTATGTVTVTGSGAVSRSVTINNIKGNGTLGISIAANTAQDNAGHQAPAAGPSGGFTVYNPPKILAVSPNGGEALVAGKTYPITWQYGGNPGPTLKIELLSGTKSTVLTTSAASSANSWSWAIPIGIASGTNYKIRITSNKVASCTRTSAAAFTIVKASGLLSSAGPDQAVQGSSLVTLSGANTIEAPKGGVSYEWTQLDGPKVTLSTPSGRVTTFEAPAEGTGGKSLRFQLTASGEDGGLSQDTCIVNVSAGSEVPSADAGLDRTVFPSEIVQLDGSKSSGKGADISSYQWKQIAGTPVELQSADSAGPTFVAPQTGACETLVFELTVADAAGLRSRAATLVTVKAESDPPVVNAGANQTVEPGAVVTLDGSNSTDDSGNIASFHWTQVSGTPVMLANPAAVKTSFIAPKPAVQSEELVFQLTATDEAGLQGRAQVAVLVRR